MFKVVCIDATQRTLPVRHHLKENDIYTVALNLGDRYVLKEHPTNDFGVPCNFDKSRFLPLSEIDETTFEREHLNQTV